MSVMMRACVWQLVSDFGVKKVLSLTIIYLTNHNNWLFVWFQTTVNEKNELIEMVKKEVKKWRTQNDQNLKYEREPAAMPHHKKKQKTGSGFSPNASKLGLVAVTLIFVKDQLTLSNRLISLSDLWQDQIWLLLDYLLEENLLAHKTLCSLRSTFKLQNCNADVRHQWCELVIKHSYVQGELDGLWGLSVRLVVWSVKGWADWFPGLSSVSPFLCKGMVYHSVLFLPSRISRFDQVSDGRSRDGHLLVLAASFRKIHQSNGIGRAVLQRDL